jgi:hypothetical protein
VDRERAALADAGAGDLAVLGESVEIDAEGRLPLGGAETRVSRGCLDDPLAGGDHCVLDVLAAPDSFDDEVGRAIEQVDFAEPGRTARADRVVEIETRAQDRRIADPTGDLERQAGG